MNDDSRTTVLTVMSAFTAQHQGGWFKSCEAVNKRFKEYIQFFCLSIPPQARPFYLVDPTCSFYLVDPTVMLIYELLKMIKIAFIAVVHQKRSFKF